MRKCVPIILVFVLLFTVLCPASLAETAHYMGLWYYQPEGLHWAKCTRCDTYMTVECECFECDYEGEKLSVCPVCGHFGEKDGEVLRAGVLVYDYTNSPVGDLLLIRYEAPFEDKDEVLAAYSVIFEYAGCATAFDGVTEVSVPFGTAEGIEILRAEENTLEEVDYSFDAGTSLLTFKVVNGGGLFLVRRV